MVPSVPFKIFEKDILKTILEFLETRGLHITQLSLERETGIINGEYSDDVLFLRQLILDGQWDDALDFVDPLKELVEFDFRNFRYFLTKYKYFELLCIKQEPGPMHDNDFAVEEIVECLKDLEHICPTPEDYRQLCALLTLPKLSDHADFKHWNPSAARVECFHKILPLVNQLLPDFNSKTNQEHSTNERLIQLITKGIFYEACIDFCQAQALGNKNVFENGPQFTKVLSARTKLSGNDLSLVSWLEVIERAQFTMPFQQKTLDFKIEGLKKPKLEAQWTEHILATPMKPGGQFPHNLVPINRLKCAQKMTQSLILPAMRSSFTNETMSKSKRERVNHPISQSMMSDVGFSIPSQITGENVMHQSQIISSMLENSDLTKTSRPAMSTSINLNTGSTESRRELEFIARRIQPQRSNPLPPVPELSTPTNDTAFENPMTKSRLFQEFSIRQRNVSYSPMPRPPSYDGIIGSHNVIDPYMMMPNRPVSAIMPDGMPINPFKTVPQSQSTMGGMYNPNAGYLPPLPQTMSMPPPVSASSVHSPLPVQFIPLCRYEDSQAIRAVAFHPSGRYFAVGTNSKQLLICKYPDIRRRPASTLQLAFGPDIVLSRPKQHRGSVYCCGFSPAGDMIATGSNDKTIRLMSFNSEECKIGAELELSMHDGTVRELIFMDDPASRSPVLVSGGAGNCHIYLTDCTTGQTSKQLPGHTAPILGMYSWGGCSFVSCSQDKSIRFWDLRTSNSVNVINPNIRTSNAPVTSVCVDPSGKLLVSGHEDASVMLYDIIGGKVIQIFRPHGDEVRTVRFSNAAYYLLSGSYDRRIVITDMRGDLTSPLMYLPVAEHNDKIIQCRWHPQDFTFLSTSADRTVVLWSLPQL